MVTAVTAWAVLRMGANAPPTPIRRLPVKEEHYVTPEQLARTGQLTDVRIESFTALSSAGQRFEFPAGQPLVVVFIKRDCPCSVDFEPYFQRLHSAYGDAICFVGIIDADVAGASAYASANCVPYPVLADPDLQIIHRFQAEHGSYLALVQADGTLAALWPGISAAMFREVSGQIAQLAQVPERVIDASGVPTALMTGCPYGKE